MPGHAYASLSGSDTSLPGHSGQSVASMHRQWAAEFRRIPYTQLMRSLIATLVFSALACFGGCATSQNVNDDPLGDVPGDLTLNVAVVPGPDAPFSTKAHLERGRFIVYPDGSLRYGAHDEYPVRWMPPLVRRLSRAQMAAIWNDLVNTGLGNPDAGSPPVNMHLQKPPEKGWLYMVDINADGRTWQFIEPVTDVDSLNPAIYQLVRDLAALSWASDLPNEETVTIPKRYDHGPDPYAQYRESSK